jgi:hypothetical protein
MNEDRNPNIRKMMIEAMLKKFGDGPLPKKPKKRPF